MTTETTEWRPASSGRFTIIPDWLIEHEPSVGANALATYAALASHADARGICYPSISRLAKILDRSRSTVQRALDTLGQAGAITKTARHSDRSGGQTSNLYQLHAWAKKPAPEPTKEPDPHLIMTHPPVHNDLPPGSLLDIPRVNIGHELEPRELDPRELNPSNSLPRPDKRDANEGKELEARSSQLPQKLKRDESGRRVYPEPFEEFWNIYPVKNDKASAYKAYRDQIMKEQVDHEVIMAGARRYAHWAESNPDRRIMYAQGWLNRGRWEDELDTDSGGASLYSPDRFLAYAQHQLDQEVTREREFTQPPF